MRRAAGRVRPDQIAELTRGLDLPLERIEAAHIAIIAERLWLAFSDIRAQWPATVLLKEEPEVNTMMESRLLRLIEEDLFWAQLVLSVARGKESQSFDGSHLEMRPDLLIYLSNRTQRFPLVVEAKILDSGKKQTEVLYCDHGIRRFVDGEYAWGSREAFMIAYVRDGSSIDATLKPYLLTAMKSVPPGYLVEQLPTHTEDGPANLAYSQHGRAFVYLHQTHPPGPITLWHLWLS